jgi:hypothetical protein
MAVLGLLGLVSASGCGGSARRLPPPRGVPSYFVKAIETGYPGMDYLPSRLPKGFRYDSSRTYATSYDVYYDAKGIIFGTTFEMLQAPCHQFGRARHTFHVNGRRIQWSATPSAQQAWLCLTSKDGHSFGIWARAAYPGDANLASPRRRRDARRLAYLVGYALRTSVFRLES